jgi:hypothetical protein
MGPIGCPETSIRDCHYSLRNSHEESSPHQHHGGSLKSRLAKFINRKHENSFCDFLFHIDRQKDGLHTVKAIATFLPNSHRGFSIRVPRRICGGRSNIGTGLSASSLVCPPQDHSSHSPLTYQQFCLILALDIVLNKTQNN